MIKNMLEMTIETIDRINRCITSTGVIYARIAGKYQAGQDGKRSNIVALLVDVRTYTIANVGVMPPWDAMLQFKHSDYTIQRIEKARRDLRGLYALLSATKAKQSEKQYDAIMQLLKDMRTHVTKLKG